MVAWEHMACHAEAIWDTMPDKILIIEDDECVRSALKLRLESEQFDVIIAESGSVGLHAAEQEAPQLIVLGLSKADLDGLSVLDRLRSQIVTWDIPVVVLSSEIDPDTEERSRALGSLRFLRKPLSPQFIVGAIKDLLGLAR